MAYLERYITMKSVLDGFLRSPFLQPKPEPKPDIRFEFSFESHCEMYIENQESTSRYFLGYLLPSVICSTSVDVAVGESLLDDDIREAVRKATVFLLDHEREVLMDFACKRVRKNFPTETLPKNKVLLLCFRVWIENKHVRIVESDYPHMIPASDSSLALLEKYEVDRVKEEEESGCCICMEELDNGEGALRMPCSHVFHGGCIKQWLSTSHYCPLCRYEMPTQSEADLGRC